METIKSYVETMFKVLPEDEAVLKAKQGVLESMEDKYNALKAEGRSEAEAVGQVISEFGNIDEITAELGIEEKKVVDQPVNERFVTDDEVDEYINANRTSGKLIGIGVMLCIIAPAALIFISSLSMFPVGGYVLKESYSGTLGLCAMFLLIAVAVALFIINGIKLERYESYEKNPIKISNSMRARLTEENNAYTTRFAVSIASGVGLIFVGVIAMIVLSALSVGDLIAVPAMLVCIAMGVFLFINAGMRRGSYEVLLETGDHKREKKTQKNTKGGKIVNAINSIMWPLVVAGYLIWSFTTSDWGITWIVFPIAGLISGALEGVAKAIDGKDA